MRGYAAAGASGIQLEDQEFPKKCGHTEFRRVIPADDAVAKIRVAVDARPSRDFLIVARTDARYAEGMDARLRRAERFLKPAPTCCSSRARRAWRNCAGSPRPSGAPRCSPTWSRAAARRTVDERACSDGFQDRALSRHRLPDRGGGPATRLPPPEDDGIGTGGQAPMLPFAEMNELMGFPAVHAFEKRHGLAESQQE